MLGKARLAVRKRQTRRRREEEAARCKSESVYGCSSVPLYGGSELGVPSQLSTAGSSHVFRPLWSEEKVSTPDEPNFMAKPIHFSQEFSSKHFNTSMGPPLLQMTTCRDGPTAYLLLRSYTRFYWGREESKFPRRIPPKLSVTWGEKSRSSRVLSASCASAMRKHLEQIAEEQAETPAHSLKESGLQQGQQLIGLHRKVEEVLWALTVTKQSHPGEADAGKLNPSAKDSNSQLGYSEVRSPSRSFHLQAPTSSAEGQVGFESGGLQTETQPQSPKSPEPPKSHTDPPSSVDFVSALLQALPFYGQQQQKPSVATTPTKTKLAAFSGDTSLSWEPYFCHMVQKVVSWSDLQMVQEFGCKLQGKALEYYYTLEPARRETDLT